MTTPLKPCVHEYKVWRKFFALIRDGKKLFEARLHDRQEHKPEPGCVLRLKEALEPTGALTGEVMERRVTYRLDGGRSPVAYLPDNFFIAGFQHPDSEARAKYVGPPKHDDVRDAEKWAISTAVTIHEREHDYILSECPFPICKALAGLARRIAARSLAGAEKGEE